MARGVRDLADAPTRVLGSPGSNGFLNCFLKKSLGDRQGQYSIRINDQWRICFEWPYGASGPINVEIADYH